MTWTRDECDEFWQFVNEVVKMCLVVCSSFWYFSLMFIITDISLVMCVYIINYMFIIIPYFIFAFLWKGSVVEECEHLQSGKSINYHPFPFNFLQHILSWSGIFLPGETSIKSRINEFSFEQSFLSLTMVNVCTLTNQHVENGCGSMFKPCYCCSQAVFSLLFVISLNNFPWS